MPSSLPGPPADHHAVGGSHPLHLHHPLALAGAVGGVELLGDHALARLEPWARPSAGSFASGVSSIEPAAVLFLPPSAATSDSSRSRRSANGWASSFVLPLGEQVEGPEQRRRLLGEHPHPRLGRVEAVLERVELLAAVGVEDHQLAIEHVAAGRELELGEVATQRLARSRLKEEVVAVDERQHPKAVELRLVHPLLALGHLLAGERQLGLDGRLQGQGQRPRY